jgi:hypothetical protein
MNGLIGPLSPHIYRKFHGPTALGFGDGNQSPLLNSRGKDSSVGRRPGLVNRPKWTSDERS